MTIARDDSGDEDGRRETERLLGGERFALGEATVSGGWVAISSPHWNCTGSQVKCEFPCVAIEREEFWPSLVQRTWWIATIWASWHAERRFAELVGKLSESFGR